MHGALAAALEREHREIDDAIASYLDDVAAGKTSAELLARAMAALRRHIYVEEEFVFPPLREAGLVAPIMVMVREHARLWQALDTLDRQLAEDSANVGLIGELTALLDAHNLKEERIVYPQATAVLSPDVDRELTDFLDTGTMPDGWVCEGARS